MASKVRGKTVPPTNGTVKLSVKTSIPAYTKLLRLIVDLSEVGENTTRSEGVELLEQAGAWLMKYCDLTEEALEEYDLNELAPLLQEAEAAFGNVSVPKPKSAT